MHAHGAGLLRWGGRFYWYGETAKQWDFGTHGVRHDAVFSSSCQLTPADAPLQVNCYSSSDLVRWRKEGLVLHSRSVHGVSQQPLSPHEGFVIERPKVVHSEGSRSFVMFFHLDGPGSGSSGWVAVSGSGTPAAAPSHAWRAERAARESGAQEAYSLGVMGVATAARPTGAPVRPAPPLWRRGGSAARATCLRRPLHVCARAAAVYGKAGV